MRQRSPTLLSAAFVLVAVAAIATRLVRPAESTSANESAGASKATSVAEVVSRTPNTASPTGTETTGTPVRPIDSTGSVSVAASAIVERAQGLRVELDLAVADGRVDDDEIQRARIELERVDDATAEILERIDAALVSPAGTSAESETAIAALEECQTELARLQEATGTLEAVLGEATVAAGALADFAPRIEDLAERVERSVEGWIYATRASDPTN